MVPGVPITGLISANCYCLFVSTRQIMAINNKRNCDINTQQRELRTTATTLPPQQSSPPSPPPPPPKLPPPPPTRVLLRLASTPIRQQRYRSLGTDSSGRNNADRKTDGGTERNRRAAVGVVLDEPQHFTHRQIR